MTVETPIKKTPKRPMFCLNFERHVQLFMSEHRLMSNDKKMLLSVSGGVDSMALAEIFYHLKLPFELLHFNHGTRGEENKKEEALVSAFARKHSLKLHVVYLDMSLKEKNFEKKARLMRLKVYRDFILKNYWVYTAHHIDDSFEWSLMQSFKQSGLKSKLGIPVFNRGIVRPFMCVTKKQISFYAKASKLSWYEDSSNNDERFERNFLRKNLTEIILKKYPKALSHYVAQNNELLLLHKLKDKKNDLKMMEGKGGILLISAELKYHKEEIKNQIRKLSKKERGLLSHEVDKLISAQEEMLSSPEKFPFKGPFHFSGDVRAFLIRDHLLIMGQNHAEFYKAFDQRLVNHIQNLAQIPDGLFIDHFPFILLSYKKNLKKSSKFIHPLLPVTCMWLKNHNISYVFTPLLQTNDKHLSSFDAVILDSSVLGL